MLYTGEADWSLIAEVKRNPRMFIPIIGNGDINGPEKAKAFYEQSGVDALMIGRGAIGRPWIFRDVNALLSNQFAAPLLRTFKTGIILQHLESLYAFYGEYTGVRMARKHLARYCELWPETRAARSGLLAAEDSASQFELARQVFDVESTTADCEELKR